MSPIMGLLPGRSTESLLSQLRRDRHDPAGRTSRIHRNPRTTVGPILACHLLAELGEAARFRRARQAVRAAGLDPVVDESGETHRRGRLAKHGAPALRWALVEAAQHAPRANSPDRGLYTQAATRVGGKRAVLTVARKIGRRAYHVLRELEAQAA
jgi:transposase